MVKTTGTVTDWSSEYKEDVEKMMRFFGQKSPDDIIRGMIVWDSVPEVMKSDVINSFSIQNATSQSMFRLVSLGFKSEIAAVKLLEISKTTVDPIGFLGFSALLTNEIEKMVYRPVGEVYIPIPDSKNFHKNFPDFFAKNAGKLKQGKASLALPKENRTFKLKFISSGNVIDAYINQDAGKAIQSIDRQDILGEWLLRGVFQLEERELLTS